MIETKDHLLDEGFQALKEADWVVSKIGGRNACDFQGNFERIAAKKAGGKKQAVIFSALRTEDFNTTTQLNQIANQVRKESRVGELNSHLVRNVTHKINEIKGRLTQIIKRQVEPEYQKAMLEVLEAYVKDLKKYILAAIRSQSMVRSGTDFLVRTGQESFSVTGWGEDTVEALYREYFKQRGLSTAAFSTDRQQIYAEPDSLRTAYHAATAKVLGEDIIIAGGYEASLGETRGYSDPKAALLTEGLAHHGSNVVLVVEKQQPIFTADPRLLPSAHTIPVMSSTFAAEVFGLFGGEAGALHHLVLPMLNGSDAKVVVMNPADPSQGSTCIYKGATMHPTTVVAKKHVPVLHVHGPMSNQKGVAAKVTEALAKHSIDQIYTAENEMRVTLSASGEAEDVEFSTDRLGNEYKSGIGSSDVVVCVSTSDLISCGNTVLKEAGLKVASSSFVSEVGRDSHVHVSSYVVNPADSTKAVACLHNAFTSKATTDAS